MIYVYMCIQYGHAMHQCAKIRSESNFDPLCLDKTLVHLNPRSKIDAANSLQGLVGAAASRTCATTEANFTRTKSTSQGRGPN